MVFGITADVLNRHRDFEKIPDLSNLVCGEPGRFKRVGHGKQVVSISSVHAAPAEMVRQPGRAGALDEILEAAKMLPVGPAGRTEIHRNSVLHDFVLVQYLIEDVERAPPVNHEVFGNNFEPVYDRLSS